jgi:hypothetical protein
MFCGTDISANQWTVVSVLSDKRNNRAGESQIGKATQGDLESVR